MSLLHGAQRSINSCFHFNQSSSTFNRPISSSRPAYTATRGVRARFFHCAIYTGCTPNADAISLIVRSPRSATTATFALNAALGTDAPICQDTRSGGLDDLLASAEIGHDAVLAPFAVDQAACLRADGEQRVDSSASSDSVGWTVTDTCTTATKIGVGARIPPPR